MSFQTVRRDALYCSSGCRQKAHRVGKTQLFGAAAHVGQRGAVQSAIETQATGAARIEVLDPRQTGSIIKKAAKRGPTNAVLSTIDGQRKARQVLAGGRQKASTLADLKAARTGAGGRQIEAAVAPIRHVAEPISAETSSECAIRWLLALIMLCVDPAPGVPAARGVGTE